MRKYLGIASFTFGVCLLLGSGQEVAARQIKLPRHPDFHDGKICFSYLGDIWVVNADGSQPRRLTVHPARDTFPRYSPDGQWIAFSSNRYGNFDVFVMPAGGGEARRLTYHSANDFVVGWSRDSGHIIFSSARGLLYAGVPISNLYEVPVQGGLEEPMPTDWGVTGSYSPDGQRFVFNRHPMLWWRQHYRGSYAADLWVADLASRRYQKLVDTDTPDDHKPNNSWPMYGNGEIFFVSDREVTAKAGTPEAMKSKNNIWKIPESGGSPLQVTHHTSGTLAYPSISSDGRTIVYEENFGLWMLDTASGTAHEVPIDIAAESQENNHETLTINGEADSYDLSPSTKRAVISTHGELFTIATDKGDIRQVTRTPGVRELDPQWSPDGKWLAYVSDASGRDEIWLCDEFGDHPDRVSDADSQKGQIRWSPDSKSLLYTGTDRKLYRYDLAEKKTSVLAQSEVTDFGAMAIIDPRWSPDGQWVAYAKSGKTLLPHVYVVAATGGAEHRVTDSHSHSETDPAWTADGKHLVYLSGTEIRNIGPSRNSPATINIVSLVQEDKDPQDRGVDSEAQAAADKEKKPEDGETGSHGGSKSAKKIEVKIDWDGIERRSRSLTRTADQITTLAAAPDGKSVVFVTRGIEGGRSVQSIWSIALDGDHATRLTQTSRSPEEDAAAGPGGGYDSLQFSKDNKTLYFRQARGIYSIATAAGRSPSPAPSGRGSGPGGEAKRIQFTARVQVDHRAERKQVFEEAWRVMKHRFYDPAFHGVNWDEKRAEYEPLMQDVADQDELHNVVSQMIGELNASHTGIGPGGGPASGGTRFPGFELEPNGDYYRIGHVYRHGPADHDYVKLKTGDYLIAVDGVEIKSGQNYYKQFTDAPGSKFELTINSKPDKAGAWRTSVTPVNAAQHGTFQYQKWVDDRKDMVKKLSAGQIGYLHIRQMNEQSLRKFERELEELHHQKGLIIDQRFNPGGNIDQELLEILGQRQYQYTRGRGSVIVHRPATGFFGPMVVLENERSTSDAEVFPDGFRSLKLGKIVGVTTYGAVIGTGSYTLMDGSQIRTPGTGLWNVNGTNLENYGVPPDIYVDNTPEDFFKHRDAQLEKAVEVLKTQIESTAKAANEPFGQATSPKH